MDLLYADFQRKFIFIHIHKLMLRQTNLLDILIAVLVRDALYQLLPVNRDRHQQRLPIPINCRGNRTKNGHSEKKRRT